MDDYELDYLIGEVRGAMNAAQLARSLVTVADIRAALRAYADEQHDKMRAELDRRAAARTDPARLR